MKKNVPGMAVPVKPGKTGGKTGDVERFLLVSRSGGILTRRSHTKTVRVPGFLQERNIEVGLQIQLGWLAERVTKHFDSMIDEGVLLPIYQLKTGVKNG